MMGTATSFSRGESVVVHQQWRSTMASDWTDAVVITRTRHNGFSVFCRKHGDFSERAGDRRWSTVDRVVGLRTPEALKKALEGAEQCLDISLDWDLVLAKLAVLDWLAAATLATLAKRTAPPVPEPDVLWKQGVLQKVDTVRLSVEWGHEVHSLEMPMERWLRLCAGKVSRARSRGYYDGASFWNYWTFRLDEKNSLTVAYGEDGGIGYEGSIEDALLEGPRPNDIDVAHLALMQALQRTEP